jgi:hypothetical protein
MRFAIVCLNIVYLSGLQEMVCLLHLAVNTSLNIASFLQLFCIRPTFTESWMDWGRSSPVVVNCFVYPD